MNDKTLVTTRHEPDSETPPDHEFDKASQLESQSDDRPGVFKRAWRVWLRIAEVIGTVQMMIILTLVYWIFMPIMFLPLRIFSDPLSLKRSGRNYWVQRPTIDDTLEFMKRQY